MNIPLKFILNVLKLFGIMRQGRMNEFSHCLLINPKAPKEGVKYLAAKGGVLNYRSDSAIMCRIRGKMVRGEYDRTCRHFSVIACLWRKEEERVLLALDVEGRCRYFWLCFC